MVCARLQMREENSADTVSDMDKMVSIKGLVIRTTPVIPDMKTGEQNYIHSQQNLLIDEFSKHTSDARFVITLLTYPSTEARSLSQRDALDKHVSRKIPCKLYTTAANSQTSRS